MPIEFTEQQQRAIDALGEAPVRVIDPRTSTAYVLIPASDYASLLEWQDEERRQRAIHAIALRNAAGRLDEAQ